MRFVPAVNLGPRNGGFRRGDVASVRSRSRATTPRFDHYLINFRNRLLIEKRKEKERKEYS